MFDFFKSNQTKLLELLEGQEQPRCVKINSQDRDRWAYLDTMKQAWSVSDQLDIRPLHAGGAPRVPNDPVPIAVTHKPGTLLRRIKAACAYLNHLQYGLNDVVLVYSCFDEHWYMSKITCDTPGYIRLLSSKQSAWMEFPEQLIDNLYGGTQDIGSYAFHPYTMKILDYANAKKPTTRVTPILTMEDCTEPNKIAYDALVRVPGIPGLMDHVSKKITLDLTRLDDSSLPVFDVKEIGEAIKRMDHDVPDWRLDLNKVFIKFGKNPEPVQVTDLAKTYTNHRFFCSGLPSQKNKETYVVVNTIPETPL